MPAAPRPIRMIRAWADRRKVASATIRPDSHRPIPLFYIASRRTRPVANLGDVMSAIIVSALSGRPIVRVHALRRSPRMASIGTIGQDLCGGDVLVWGTGFAAKLKAPEHEEPTRFDLRAVRGRLSRLHLERAGYDCPAVFGDPGWFIRDLYRPPVAPRWELGVIPHISELRWELPGHDLEPLFRRYDIPDGLRGSVRLIQTYTAPDLGSVLACLDEIRSCKRIVSTSFHGFVFALAYGIPALFLNIYPTGARALDIVEEPDLVDHRFRDWWSGLGLRSLPAYGNDRDRPTDWEDVIAAVDRLARPLEHKGEGLLEAFPFPLKVDPLACSGDLLSLAPQIRRLTY